MDYKELPAFNGMYRIYEDGRIFSNVRKNKNREWYAMHQQTTDRGYKRVHLRLADGTKKTYRVHQLVATCFLSPADSPERKFINHKDSNKSNNHFSNLEWCTHAENMLHAKMHGLLGRNPDEGGKPVSVTFEFPTASTAERFLNLPKDTIARWARGINKHSRTHPITDVHYLKEYKG